MRQFVHQHQLGFARQSSIEIEFGQHPSAIFDLQRRQHFQTFEQGSGFAAAVSFDHPDHHVETLFANPAACALQHGKGFTDTGRGAEKYFQPAALTFSLIALQFIQQFVGVGSFHGSFK